jgi:hypothetical protein
MLLLLVGSVLGGALTLLFRCRLPRLQSGANANQVLVLLLLLLLLLPPPPPPLLLLLLPPWLSWQWTCCAASIDEVEGLRLQDLQSRVWASGFIVQG